MPQACPSCNKECSEHDICCAACGTTLQEKRHLSSTAALLDNRYEILCCLKTGGMGAVYKARDTRLGTVVAIKKMLSSFSSLEEEKYGEMRFREEAALLSRLHHGGLPKVFDFFLLPDPETGKKAHYLAMTFIEGKDFETLIEEKKAPFQLIESMTILRQILNILDYLHSQSPPVIYRDLNPRNIMKSGDTIFLIDFGIAKVFSPQRQATVIGTPGYASPEQYKGQAEPRSDLYSLGVFMHYLLTGINPESREQTLFSFTSPKKTNLQVPEYLDHLIMSMVDIVPEKRPESARQIVEMLNVSERQGSPDLQLNGRSDERQPPGQSAPLRRNASSARELPPVTLKYGSIHEAIEKNDPDAVREFIADVSELSTKNDKGWLPLHTAAYHGHLQIAELLISKGADVQARRSEGWTPLHLAALHGHSDIAGLFLKYDANPDIRKDDLSTPLHMGAQGGHREVVELLLARGVDVNARRDDGWTPLHAAAYYNHTEVAEMLIEHGSDVGSRDKAGHTPLHIAKTYGHKEVMALLRKYGKSWWKGVIEGK
ncbi:MAG: ankyrin repeat domain-containing protein [Candidatus Xenobiia bacterium LiM19]